MLVVVSVSIFLAIGFAMAWYCERGLSREREHLIASWRERAWRESELRTDYERALGLPFYCRQSVERDLWARAHQGDELAREIIETRMTREAERLLIDDH